MKTLLCNLWTGPHRLPLLVMAAALLLAALSSLLLRLLARSTT